ncbi:MAG TPA: tetratricopeptide repeat protein [Bacteroidia bacterium]
MKKVLLVVAVVFAVSGFGQNKKIDSLQALLKTDKQDTNKVKHLSDLGWILKQSNPDTAIILGNQALSIAEKTEWKKGIAKSLSNLGTYYRLKGNYLKALDYFLKALKIDEELKDKSGMAKRLGNIGIVYYNQADYPKALDYYFKALKIAKELKDKKEIAIWFGNIGIVYYDQKDYPKALDYFFKALKINEELGRKNGIANTLGNIGNVYKNQKDYPKALTYYFKALKMAEELGDKNNVAIWLGNIGSLYTTQKKYTEAETYLLDALKIDKEIGAQDGERVDEDMLSKLYEQTGRHKEALVHYKSSMLLKDTIFSQENKKQLIKKEMNFEFEKKEIAAKAEQDKIDAITAQEKKRQQFVIYGVAGVLVLVAVFAVFMYNRFRVTQKQKVIIEKQKHLVEEHQKEIIDSITYAKRLQQAILPSADEINKYLPNHFLYYQPKDIVAGDFYWMEHRDNFTFIAAADSTGHGVPGAMVSVVCSNALNRAVKEFNLTDTGLILDKTRELVIETFEKSDKDVKDGMDISLLRIKKEDRGIEVQWSGANNSLWYVQNSELVEIKANKQPIGKCSEPVPFTTNKFVFDAPVTFYLFSDGYADQFSSTGKKLMKKKFKEIVMAIQNLPMNEQGQHLEKVHVDWKSTIEQTDDVLVIGVKV